MSLNESATESTSSSSLTARESPIGDCEVAVLVPSRRQKGEPIDPDYRRQVAVDVQEKLARIFYGASARVERESLRGSFLHDDGTDRVTVEPDERIYSIVDRSVLENEEKRKAVLDIAAEVASKLEQESVLMGWGAHHVCVKASPVGAQLVHRPFRELGRVTQEGFAVAACARIRGALDLRGVLSLDGWSFVAKPAEDPEQRMAWKGERRALILESGHAPPSLNEGDLAFADAPDAKAVLVWAHVGGKTRGPRRLPLGGARPTRIAFEIALALLDSSLVEPLGDILDKELATAAFFRRYASLRDRIARAMGRAHGPVEHRAVLAQRYLGRLMFLRFLEARGWLGGDHAFLRKAFDSRGDRSFANVLDELFGQLDDPEQARHPGVPYMNGGLFHLDSASPRLDDSIFDPNAPDSVFALFGAYQFTVDERASADRAVAVDPGMFGHVLECLREPQKRKIEGVVYTPRPVAHALAFEAIVRRLADLTRIDRELLARFTRGAHDALDKRQVEQVHKHLRKLRIVDPAVGSGSLLLAALDVLMQISAACHAQRGITLVRGGGVWADETRHFVRNALYGVDLDGDAVEVARLRLWLAIAVGDREPQPLPDLARHVCMGDSLGSRAFDRAMLEKGLWERQGELFAKADDAVEAYKAALARYEKASRRGGTEAHEAFSSLQEEEHRLFTRLRTKARTSVPMPAGGGVPFAWMVHFGEVFARSNKGFDVVIANPPYVRTRNLDDDYDDYESMTGNSDLYHAFVERGLDLAGNAGQVAYVLPNFGERKAGKLLRELLGRRGAVDRMVSFGHQQVFRAANYVALLFATGRVRKNRKSFQGGYVENDRWRTAEDSTWLDNVSYGEVPYQSDPWKLLGVDADKVLAALGAHSIPLGELCTTHVGVQTGRDPLFLLDQGGPQTDDLVPVRSAALDETVLIEREVLRRCAKGSVHLRPYRLLEGCFMFWPYEGTAPITENRLKAEYPRAWSYIKRIEPMLKSRDLRHLPADRWWGFGRSHAIKLCGQPKIIVPAAQRPGVAAAYFDEAGEVATTSSGTGGGGAQHIQPRPGLTEPAADPVWLLAVLNSPDFAAWVRIEGSPQQSGWRGLDATTLKRAPVPRPTEAQLRQVHGRYALVKARLAGRASLSEGEFQQLVEPVNEVVHAAFNLHH